MLLINHHLIDVLYQEWDVVNFKILKNLFRLQITAIKDKKYAISTTALEKQNKTITTIQK
mgnify:CR=1 FL=1